MGQTRTELPIYVFIDGKRHKLCTGPAHEEPTYLPATEKYYHARKSGVRRGKLVSRCRLCINWNKLKVRGSYHGIVPMVTARPVFIEAVNRVGVTELARRSGVSQSTIENVLHHRGNGVQKMTLRKVMLELVSMQRHNENSINGQARWRRDRRNSNGLGVHASMKGIAATERHMTQ